jgi:hypothetical protein
MCNQVTFGEDWCSGRPGLADLCRGTLKELLSAIAFTKAIVQSLSTS